VPKRASEQSCFFSDSVAESSVVLTDPFGAAGRNLGRPNKNREYLDAAEEILKGKAEASGKDFNGSLEAIVNLACTMALRDAGVCRLGQRIEVLQGNHKGYRGIIEIIDWNEASVRCKGNPRWFCVWGKPNYFRII
jgi:hypothetical protein